MFYKFNSFQLFSICASVFLFFVVCAGTANAATKILMNGATCIPYPPYGERNIGVSPVDHYLFGFKGSANCHFTLHNDTRAAKVMYAVVDGGTSGSGEVVFSLCTYQWGSQATSCGREVALQGEENTAYLYPADDVSGATGMFVRAKFPPGDVSIIRIVTAVFDS